MLIRRRMEGKISPIYGSRDTKLLPKAKGEENPRAQKDACYTLFLARFGGEAKR